MPQTAMSVATTEATTATLDSLFFLLVLRLVVDQRPRSAWKLVGVLQDPRRKEFVSRRAGEIPPPPPEHTRADAATNCTKPHPETSTRAQADWRRPGENHGQSTPGNARSV